MFYCDWHGLLTSSVAKTKKNARRLRPIIQPRISELGTKDTYLESLSGRTYQDHAT